MSSREERTESPPPANRPHAHPGRARAALHGALGGASFGALFWLLPDLAPGWSSAQDFRGFLIELLLGRMEAWSPPALLAWSSSSAGTLVFFAGAFALAGALVGALVACRVRRVATAAAAACAGFALCAWGIVWCRLVLFHHTSHFLTPVGLCAAAASLVLGAAGGLGVFRLLRRRWVVALAVGAVALLLGFATLRRGEPASPPPAGRPRVLYLALDALDFDVLDELESEGRCPNFARLRERSATAPLRTTLPWKTPIIWTTVATGRREHAHGISDFVAREPASGHPVPISIASRRLPAFWDVASRAGRSIAMVNWYGGWPAEELDGGVWISDRFHWPELSHRVWPAERLAELEQVLGEQGLQGADHEVAMAALALHLLEHEPSDLWVLYLRETDHEAHLAWKDYALPRGSRLTALLHGPAGDPPRPDELTRAYEEADRVLGRALELAPDAFVLITSDHGAGVKAPGQRLYDLDPLLEFLGLEEALLDRTPHDWTAERLLFLRAGHEPAELAHAASRLEAVATADGEPVFGQVELRSDHIAARVSALEGEVRAPERAEALALERVSWRTERSGTHRMNGVFLLAGPGVRPGPLREVGVADVTPTLLYLLDLPLPEDFEGRFLRGAFSDEFLSARPVTRIPSYGARESSSVEESAADAELIERLKELGYL